MPDKPNENTPSPSDADEAPSPDASAPAEAPADADASSGADEDAIEKMMMNALDQAQDSIEDIQQVAGAGAASGGAVDHSASGIDLLNDVDLHVVIELGRTEMLVEDVLKLNTGSVVELDKLAGDPVDVYVNNRLIARGEVLVLNDNFCIRVSEIVDNLEEQAESAAEELAPAAG